MLFECRIKASIMILQSVPELANNDFKNKRIQSIYIYTEIYICI